jgi:cholesterol transport system auxiliary component
MRGLDAMRATSAMRRTLSLTVLGLALLGTSACVRFGANPPERLLGISTDARIVAGKSTSSPADGALFVELPSVPRAIATQRVAVHDKANSYAYVKDALWVDSPARQFKAMLSETIAARTDKLVLDPGQYPTTTGHVLRGDLVDFGVDGATRTAVVTYDANLLANDGKAILRQRFSASRPLSKIDSTSVAPAISQAANEVAAAVADWIKAQP